MSEQIRCFFVGHSDAAPSVYPVLLRAVEKHIEEYNVTEFIVGHYGNFDSLAARAVAEAKRKYSGITLTMLLPYYPSQNNFLPPAGFDGSWYPSELETVPSRVAIIRANQCAIDNSNYLIAYVRHPGSNARKLLEYATGRARVTEL